jgi:hypothetical protein
VAADIRDVHDAQAATTDALARLDNARELAFDQARARLAEDPSGELLDRPPLLQPDTLALLAGLEAIAFAVRELGVRLDYVAGRK